MVLLLSGWYIGLVAKGLEFGMGHIVFWVKNMSQKDKKKKALRANVCQV